jgi:hypothetical protein
MQSQALPLSIVIPCAAGERAQFGLLGDLAGLRCAHEILLVTVRGDPTAGHGLPTLPSLRLLASESGRARQQNLGAAVAGGEWLCFLHADSRLGKDALAALEALPGSDPALSYFDLRFASDGPRLTMLNAFGARLRSDLLGLPFGDQGLSLRREDFFALGGFDQRLPRGEDHALVWAARRSGLPLRRLRAPIVTSARRYAEHGWLRTTVRFLGASLMQARQFARGQRP